MRKLLVGIFALIVIFFVVSPYLSVQKTSFGVTFSPRYAKYLKLNWQETYKEILNLGVKKLRIPLYWEDIEPKEGNFNFTDADFMLSYAKEKNAVVIVVLGVRQPRWPECHVPNWVKQLSVSERQNKTLEFIGKVLEKYKNNVAVGAWQVENEPLLPFGDNCDKPDKNFLKKEVNLVRSLSNKKIIMTDSGELGFWATSMQLSDIFGTTLYRTVYDIHIGYVTYPIPPVFYQMKSNLIRNLFASQNQKTIIVELQAEPWLAGGNFVSPDQQTKHFSTLDFKNYVDFSQKTGFDEAYLWGVEWWYFMAAHGHPEYLDYAKTLFK